MPPRLVLGLSQLLLLRLLLLLLLLVLVVVVVVVVVVLLLLRRLLLLQHCHHYDDDDDDDEEEEDDDDDYYYVGCLPNAELRSRHEHHLPGDAHAGLDKLWPALRSVENSAEANKATAQPSVSRAPSWRPLCCRRRTTWTGREASSSMRCALLTHRIMLSVPLLWVRTDATRRTRRLSGPVQNSARALPRLDRCRGHADLYTCKTVIKN